MRLLGLALAAVVFAGACGSSTRSLPRLDRYDFLGATPAELVSLRQIATAEGPEGALARYALARAHADWLVLALIRDREDDLLLRRLAVDLAIEGATDDERLPIEGVMATFDRVLDEVGQASTAGPEARAWATATGRLLRGVRSGFESFGPEVFEAVGRASGRGGEAGSAADLLAVGWGRLALEAAAGLPAPERPALLARMAGYHDPSVVARLARGGSDLSESGLELVCPSARPGARGLRGTELLAHVRRTCSDGDTDLPEGGAAAASPELAVVVRVLDDLLARRARLDRVRAEPLLAAAAADLRRFDEAVRASRFPVPLPVPGPGLPDPPTAFDGAPWRPAAAIVVAGGDGRLSVGLWPVVGLGSGGRMALLDREAGLALPGRPVGDELATVLASTWERGGVTGVGGRSVALVVPATADATLLVELGLACGEAGAERVDLVAVAPDGAVASLPFEVARGSARGRTSADRRAVAVLDPEGVLVGDADGRWTEVQDVEGQPATDRILVALGGHLAVRGVPSLVLALRPGATASRVATVLELFAPTREGAAPSPRWTVALDDQEPPGPAPAAATVAEALGLHRVRLRECYERFLREGGQGQGLIVLELVIDERGRVVDARVLSTEIGSRPVLESCLLGEGRRIRFPAAREARTLHVPLRLVPERP